jgi:uncharacterized membrane protein YhiD involved in acid resistance
VRSGAAELELFGKVLLAGLLGFVVGLERKLMGGPARRHDLGRRRHRARLTTAAGIWAVAAVGMAVATDRYLLAVLATVLIMVVFAAERFLSIKHRHAGQPRQRPTGAEGASSGAD